MSFLQHIKLIQFKNHIQLNRAFEHRITAFVGKNGCGKTNILDAIYYLCFARSYFTKTDKLIQNFDSLGFRIDGKFINKAEEININCILREDGKKEILLNKETIKKSSEFIGTNSCVMIAPDDICLINDGSEERRKWMDTILCQMDKTYLQHLQQYNKIIVQRNALLKQIAEQNAKQIPSSSATLFDFYNDQLTTAATYIFQQRKLHFITLQQFIKNRYMEIATSMDAITVHYQSQLNESSLHDLLQYNLQKDIYSQRTNYGIHKDDFVFMMNNEALKNIASQGQKKSFLLSLKLAELEFLQNNLNNQPIVLLDDIFERLDTNRIHNLFSYLINHTTCQVFITDTNFERLDNCIKEIATDYEIISLS